jgi:hypothetical protein
MLFAGSLEDVLAEENTFERSWLLLVRLVEI